MEQGGTFKDHIPPTGLKVRRALYIVAVCALPPLAIMGADHFFFS